MGKGRKEKGKEIKKREERMEGIKEEMGEMRKYIGRGGATEKGLFRNWPYKRKIVEEKEKEKQ